VLQDTIFESLLSKKSLVLRIPIWSCGDGKI